MRGLTSRQLSILTLLINNNDYISSEHISVLVGVVGKTVRADIDQMSTIIYNHYGITIEAKSGLGFKIIRNHEHYNIFLRDYHLLYKSIFPYTNNQSRLHYVVQRLVSASNYVKISDLADELYCSRTLISDTLKVVRQVLKDYNLKLTQRPNYGLKVEGRELHKRICLINEYPYYQLFKDTIYSDEYYGKLFVLQSKKKEIIQNVLLDYLKTEDSYVISNNGVEQIILAMILSLNRNIYKQLVDFTPEEEYDTQFTYSYELGSKVLSKVAEKTDLYFTESDKLFMGIIMLGYRTILSFDEVHVKQLLKNSMRIAEDVIDYVITTFKLHDLKHDVPLRKRLTMHMVSLQSRSRYNIILDYVPGYLANRYSSPAIEISVAIGEYLKKNCQLPLNRNEISYLAFLLIPALEQLKIPTNSSKRIAVLSHLSRDISLTIAEQTIDQLPNLKRSIYPFEAYQLNTINSTDFDVIVSDFPKSALAQLNLPIIPFNFMYSKHDTYQAAKYYYRKSERFKKLFSYFSEKHFYHLPEETDTNKILNSIAKKIQHSLKISESIYDDLQRRDTQYSIEKYNNIAFFKTLRNYTEDSHCFVFFLEKPIIWYKEPVQCIFAFTSGTEKDEDILDFEGAFNAYIQDSTEMVQLLTNFNYDFFYKNLRSFYYQYKNKLD